MSAASLSWASSSALSLGPDSLLGFFLCCLRALQAYRTPVPGIVQGPTLRLEQESEKALGVRGPNVAWPRA